jgi:ribonuclease PH
MEVSMRVDGRKDNELRPVTITPHYTAFAEGSALIEVGLTRVLCNVTIEDGVPRWIYTSGKPSGWVTGEYAMLPRATQKRTARETNGLSGRSQEIRRLIGRSLRMAVDLEQIGQRTLTVDCDVLQADGGTRTAAITGGYVALAIALEKLIRQGSISPQALKPPVAAVSAGVVSGRPLLDLCYEEDSQAEADGNIVINGVGELIEFQVTAEGSPFARSMLDRLLSLAETGIAVLLASQRQAIEAARVDQ